MSELILCVTGDGCTCGAPATTPAGMHHDYCPVNPASRVTLTCGMAEPRNGGPGRVCEHGRVLASGGKCEQKHEAAEIAEQRHAEWES